MPASWASCFTEPRHIPRAHWPGTYKRHVSDQYVPQLGQLVNFETAQPAAGAGDARVFTQGKGRSLSAHMHGSQLADLEAPEAASHALLKKEHGTF